MATDRNEELGLVPGNREDETCLPPSSRSDGAQSDKTSLGSGPSPVDRDEVDPKSSAILSRGAEGEAVSPSSKVSVDDQSVSLPMPETESAGKQPVLSKVDALKRKTLIKAVLKPSSHAAAVAASAPSGASPSTPAPVTSSDNGASDWQGVDNFAWTGADPPSPCGSTVFQSEPQQVKAASTAPMPLAGRSIQAEFVDSFFWTGDEAADEPAPLATASDSQKNASPPSSSGGSAIAAVRRPFPVPSPDPSVKKEQATAAGSASPRSASPVLDVSRDHSPGDMKDSSREASGNTHSSFPPAGEHGNGESRPTPPVSPKRRMKIRTAPPVAVSRAQGTVAQDTAPPVVLPHVPEPSAPHAQDPLAPHAHDAVAPGVFFRTEESEHKDVAGTDFSVSDTGVNALFQSADVIELPQDVPVAKPAPPSALRLSPPPPSVLSSASASQEEWFDLSSSELQQPVVIGMSEADSAPSPAPGTEWPEMPPWSMKADAAEVSQDAPVAESAPPSALPLAPPPPSVLSSSLDPQEEWVDLSPFELQHPVVVGMSEAEPDPAPDSAPGPDWPDIPSWSMEADAAELPQDAPVAESAPSSSLPLDLSTPPAFFSASAPQEEELYDLSPFVLQQPAEAGMSEAASDPDASSDLGPGSDTGWSAMSSWSTEEDAAELPQEVSVEELAPPSALPLDLCTPPAFFSAPAPQEELSDLSPFVLQHPVEAGMGEAAPDPDSSSDLGSGSDVEWSAMPPWSTEEDVAAPPLPPEDEEPAADLQEPDVAAAPSPFREVSWEYGTEFDLSAYLKVARSGDDPSAQTIVHPESDPPGTPLPPLDEELVALRYMLLKRELALLENLKSRFDDPIGRTREVSDILPEAIVLTAAREDDKIERALDPLINKVFKSSLRARPNDFANAIFPVMGPAIRRSIAESFRSMVDSFQRSMEMALSWKGLRLRLESMRTGRPFSEVVMLHTLIYRVEQLFLIHRETGLVLNHVVSEGIDSQDADMVSAMLTAIQDFVRDCFASGKEGDLESLQLGEHTIIVEQSPYVYLACVVRGNPPIELRRSLRNSLDLVQVEFLDELTSFKGDNDPFAASAPLLEQCLVSRFHEGPTFSLVPKVVPVLTLLVIIGGIAAWRYDAHENMRTLFQAQRTQEEKEQAFLLAMDSFVDVLRKEPGLLVIDIKDYMDPPWLITCLKDDLARDPRDVLREAGAKPEDFVITTVPYISLERDIVARRVAERIKPPEQVQMEFLADGTLRLSGIAPVDWIMRARQEALATSGVKKLDFEMLSDPRMDKLRELVREVEAVKVAFPQGRDTPTPRDAPKLERAVTTLAELEKLASEMGISVQLTIYGHADTTGDAQRNYEISQARARTLAAMLYGKGSSLPVNLYGMGAEYAKQGVQSPFGDQESRRIELRVHLARMARPTPEELR